MIQAQILADSINPQGDRITTMKITFPRIVLAEFNTHRILSRNSASSRAIPFKKILEMVRENPFIPIAWQKDHRGMQGKKYFTQPNEIDILRQKWLKARDKMIESALDLAAGIFSLDEVFEFDVNGELLVKQDTVGVTKQIVNRLLEPFMWHTVIVTATEWKNFFKLRCPQYWVGNPMWEPKKSRKEVAQQMKEEGFVSDSPMDTWDDLHWLKMNTGEAEIHISLLAEKMYDALNKSTPKQIQPREWHIPFGDNLEEELTKWVMEDCKSMNKCLSRPFDTCFCTDELVPQCMLKVAVARCARISYQTFGDNPKIDYAADIKLHDMLAANGHASPFEHVARAMTDKEYFNCWKGNIDIDYIPAQGFEYEYSADEAHNNQGWCRNFKGFIQYREILENGE